MQYIEPVDAKSMTGLRLALTRDVPAPYSMAARAIFDHHRLPYTPVAQQGGGRNEDLVAWTRHRNAPIAMYEEEAPRTGWLEILNLAERLGDGSSLFPEQIDDRMRMIGLTNELIGENGWIWQLRIVMLGLGGPERAAQEAERNPMYQDYGYSEANKTHALSRAAEILSVVSAHLEAQYAANQNQPTYFFGNRLSALDIYWVFFSQLVETFPDEKCPMPSFLRKSYDRIGATIDTPNSILIQHRNRIVEEHLDLPFSF